MNDICLVLADDGKGMLRAAFIFGLHAGAKTNLVERLLGAIHRDRRIEFGLEVTQVALDLRQFRAIEILCGLL
jgi:hypothetical protein